MELTVGDVLVLSVLVGYCTIMGVFTILQTLLLLKLYRLVQEHWR